MKAVVKQAFDYSADGLTIVRLRAGEVREISDALFPGLLAARFVEPFVEKAGDPPASSASPRASAQRHHRFEDKRR